MYLLHKVFGELVRVTDFLQKLGLDLIQAMNSIKAFQAELSQIQNKFDQIIEEPEELIKKVNDLIMRDEYIQTRSTCFVIKVYTGKEKEDILSRVKNELKNYIDKLQEQIKELFLNEFENDAQIYRGLISGY